MVIPLELIGLFNLIKDQDLTVFCETQEELDVFNQFTDFFLILRKLATDIDEYIFSQIGDNFNGSVGVWNKFGEYCKLKLLGFDKEYIQKRIKTWVIRIEIEKCEKICEIFLNDEELNIMLNKLKQYREKIPDTLKEIKALKGFKFNK